MLIIIRKATEDIGNSFIFAKLELQTLVPIYMDLMLDLNICLTIHQHQRDGNGRFIYFF